MVSAWRPRKLMPDFAFLVVAGPVRMGAHIWPRALTVPIDRALCEGGRAC